MKRATNQGNWHETGLKTCTQCGETKPLASFSLSRRASATQNAVYRPNCKPCSSARALEWFRANKTRNYGNHRRHRLTFYGLTPQAYADLLQKQGGVCAICGQIEAARRRGTVMALSVDHDHMSGEVRGLLCQRCNRAMGLLGDDASIMRHAISYLMRSQIHEVKEVGK